MISKQGPFPGQYDIYPALPMEEGRIQAGFESLALRISNVKFIGIDGYIGVDFEHYRRSITSELAGKGIASVWINMQDFMKSAAEITAMTLEYMGADDPLFGYRTSLKLLDFFQFPIPAIQCHPEPETLTIVYGIGASLVVGLQSVIYIDLPKNSLQQRAKSGIATNLGLPLQEDYREVYKRYYFVDWIVLNRHKSEILQKIDLLVDDQDEIPVWLEGDDFRQALFTMSRNVFRVRPWFEPGVWGGNWMMKNIPGLEQNVKNYAWSFELIVPENGLMVSSGHLFAEFSFDFLMFAHAENVLGADFERFGFEFPIRFDFLDTFDGGNLSIQCHPRVDYMKDQFGEDFTQEECYYILDTQNNADVYLGFQENIEAEEFRNALHTSFKENKVLDIEQFVQKHPAEKHDFFLIPSGTIHGSGKDNLVLEISSTPYIFTFKMYDWLRPDLNGKPRPLNIERGMENLYFERKGEVVTEELLCKPYRCAEGHDWECYHLPTHPEHLYDVIRYHFHSKIHVETLGKCHVLSLVEGQSIVFRSQNGYQQRFHYAETFVVPANAKSYSIQNESIKPSMLIIAFIK